MQLYPKKIYLEPSPAHHAFARQLLAFPPCGFEFFTNQLLQTKMYKLALLSSFTRNLIWSVPAFMPTSLLRAWLNRRNRAPEGAVLSYTTDQLILRKEPWVIEVEYASLSLGSQPRYFKRFRGILERSLSSPFCRKIICWSQVGRRSLLDLDCRGFEHKVEQIDFGVLQRRFHKQYRSDNKVRLLFVGSVMLTAGGRGFVHYGGREVLDMFVQLRHQYNNLELVVRCDVPPGVKARYGGVEGLRILERIIPQEEMEREFQAADIFVMPSQTTSPLRILDAMSYELPSVIIDAWANPEYVEHGKTGLVAHKSRRLKYYYANTHQPNFGTAEFVKAIQTPDPEVVADLAKQVSLLIENPELRRTLGKAARHEVESGRFSLARMNEELGRIFNEAIAADD